MKKFSSRFLSLIIACSLLVQPLIAMQGTDVSGLSQDDWADIAQGTKDALKEAAKIRVGKVLNEIDTDLRNEWSGQVGREKDKAVWLNTLRHKIGPFGVYNRDLIAMASGASYVAIMGYTAEAYRQSHIAHTFAQLKNNSEKLIVALQKFNTDEQQHVTTYAQKNFIARMFARTKKPITPLRKEIDKLGGLPTFKSTALPLLAAYGVTKITTAMTDYILCPNIPDLPPTLGSEMLGSVHGLKQNVQAAGVYVLNNTVLFEKNGQPMVPGNEPWSVASAWGIFSHGSWILNNPLKSLFMSLFFASMPGFRNLARGTAKVVKDNRGGIISFLNRIHLAQQTADPLARKHILPQMIKFLLGENRVINWLGTHAIDLLVHLSCKRFIMQKVHDTWLEFALNKKAELLPLLTEYQQAKKEQGEMLKEAETKLFNFVVQAHELKNMPLISKSMGKSGNTALNAATLGSYAFTQATLLTSMQLVSVAYLAGIIKFFTVSHSH